MRFPVNPNTGVPHLPEYVTGGLCSPITAYGAKRIWDWEWVENPAQDLCSYCVSRLYWKLDTMLDAFTEAAVPMDPRVMSRFTIHLN
jgi:hypothetical protein